MNPTLYALAPDGMRIAYDKTGSGPAIVLIHGGGGSRLDWHGAGYVEHLRHEFKVVSIDLRGHGESALPIDPAAYTIEKMGQDILAVTDACGCQQFILWAMSFGAKISRHLASQSNRVAKLVMMGAQLGPGVSGRLRQDALDFCAHWPPILQEQRNGTLDLEALSDNDQEMLREFNIPVMLAWVTAMLQWPAVEPADFRCPTLWLSGSEDVDAMNSIEKYKDAVRDSLVKVQIVPGLDHNQLFAEVDMVFPLMRSFSEV